MLYPASDIDWRFNSYMTVHMLECHSPESFCIVYGCFLSVVAELSNAADAIWPAERKLFTVLSFSENVCQPLMYVDDN